jgi:hypothetical protein
MHLFFRTQTLYCTFVTTNGVTPKQNGAYLDLQVSLISDVAALWETEGVDAKARQRRRELGVKKEIAISLLKITSQFNPFFHCYY